MAMTRLPSGSQDEQCSRIVAVMSDRPEDDCARRIREIYGDDLLEPAGVVHITSTWGDPEGRLFVLRIGPETPRSATDSFALELARARVDAIVTTGQVLRDEPDMTNALRDPQVVAWRRERLGKSAPPLTLVLSRDADLDRSHPLFSESEVSVRNQSLRAALEWLLDERGIASVAIETGPSTIRALYQEPVGIDELMLSICRTPVLPEGGRGAELFAPSALDRLFERCSECTREEASGTWSFLRFRS